MTTTHFFVELLVIGFGSLAWIGVLSARWLDFSRALEDPGVLSLAGLLPLLSIVYVLGILTDRIADWAFERWDHRDRRRCFKEGRERYFEYRRVLVIEAPELWAHLEYGRSRLRICRGTALNALLLIAAINLNALWPIGDQRLPTGALLIANAALLIFVALCIISWHELNCKEYEKIRRQAPWVRSRLKELKGKSDG